MLLWSSVSNCVAQGQVGFQDVGSLGLGSGHPGPRPHNMGFQGHQSGLLWTLCLYVTPTLNSLEPWLGQR